MSKLKTFVISCAAAVSAVFMTGAPSSCDPENWLDPDRYDELQRPAHARITIHSIVKYRQGDMTEQTIPTYTKEKITVGAPWLTSKEIEHIDIRPRPGKPGYYDLLLTLSQKGRREWIMLSNAHQNDNIAFVIDGVFYRSFRPRLLLNESDVQVLIDGPFDQATARELAWNSEVNYIKINRL